MNEADPSKGNITLWKDAENVEFEDGGVNVHSDGRQGGGHIDLFTNSKGFKSKGSVFNITSTGVGDSRGGFGAWQTNAMPVQGRRVWTGASAAPYYSPTSYHNESYFTSRPQAMHSPPPSVGGYGQQPWRSHTMPSGYYYDPPAPQFPTPQHIPRYDSPPPQDIEMSDAFSQVYPPSPNSAARSPSPRFDYNTGPPVHNPAGSPPPSQYPAPGSGPSRGYSYGASSAFLRPPKPIVQPEPKPSSGQFKSNNPFQKEI